MAQVTPAPSKAQKSPSKDAAYFLFSNCAPGTSLTQKTKSGKCAKSATAAAVGNPITVDVVEIVDVVDVVEVVETIIPVTDSTENGPAYFVPGKGDAEGAAVEGGGGLFGEGNEEASAGVGNGDEESAAAVSGVLDGDEAAAGVSFVGNTTTAAEVVAKDTCVVEAEDAAAGTTVEVPIKYYATMEDGASPLPTLDHKLAQYVANDMFTCATERERRVLLSSNPNPLRKGGRDLGEGECVGVNSVPEESATSESCELTVEAGQSCSAVEGGVSLVVSDSAKTESAKEKAIGSINTAFANDVFTDSNSAYYVPGLVGLEMQPAANVIPAATAGATISTNEAAADTGISAAGAVVLSLGLIAFIALALMAVRHRRNRDSAYDEFDDDDDNDLAPKDTDDSTTDGSLDEILRDLEISNPYGNQVDVHHCTSAMCPICNGQQTTFIEVGDNDTVTEAYPEEFEIGDRNRSFEYSAKPGVSSPRFDNPANIRPRLYEVEDTVDL